MCELSLAGLEPPSRLDILRGRVDVEGALAGLLELVGKLSTEHLVLRKK